MNPVQAFRALALSVLLFATAHAQTPASFLSLYSEPGDYIGLGNVWLLQGAGHTFSGSCQAGAVSAMVATPTTTWTVDVAPPEGDLLTPGVFEGVTRYPFQSPTTGGLSVGGEGRGCNKLYGRFVVREVACSATDTLEKIAVDFVQHCESRDAPALYGFLRINSTIPEMVPQPTVSAGLAQHVTEGETVQLDGSNSTTPFGVTALTWTQISGPSATLSLNASFTPTFVAPPVAPGGADLVFELSITGGNGLSDSNRVSIHVRDADDPRTFLTLVSHPGDFQGEGITRTITPLDAVFSGTCLEPPAAVGEAASITARGSARWDLRTAAPLGEMLATGSYINAPRYPFQAPTQPGFSISGDGRACNESVTNFVVREIACAPDGTLQRLAIDAEQHCGFAVAPPLFGYLRFNSSIGLPEPLDRGCRLDSDGDGTVDRARDGSLLLRALAGYRSDGLVGNDIAPGATRTNESRIRSYFENTCAVLPDTAGAASCSLDLDGDGRVLLTTDGLIALRLIAGERGPAVLNHAVATGATRQTWGDVDAYLRACKFLSN